MTTLEGRLRDPEYRNWVKSALCLQYTRDGLETFTSLKSLELNQTLIRQLCQSGNQSVYNLCPTIAFNQRRQSVTCCTVCNDILKEVMHYRTSNRNLNLGNSDPSQLLHQHWQVAKLFMNAGNVFSTGPNNTDISGLINFIDHCTVPKSYVTNQDNLGKVRYTRNRVLHTSSMKITEDDFQNDISPLLLDLLRDPGFLLTDQDANAAVEKIKEVQKADFIITQDNEKKVLETLANEIRQFYNLTSDKMRELNDQIDTLNKDVSTMDCSNKAEVKQLRDEMTKIDKEFSKVRDMCQMFRIQVEKSTDLHDEMRQQLKDIHEQTESTNESHKKLQLRVGDIEHRLSVMQEQIDSRVGDVEQRLSVTQELIYSRVGDVEQRQDQFDSRVGDVDQKLSATQELIYSRVGDVEQRQEQFHSRVGELKEAVDAVKDENKAHIPSKEDKSTLQQYLIEGYTQKLDVFLLPHWDKLHVSEIFTPSILVDDQNEKMETFERHGSLRETHSNKLAGDQRLRSYKKLLYNGNELEKRVLLDGEAGAGKTTFCKHLTDMWCQINHTNEECKLPFLQQLDVTVLKQFQYLFYISCRFAEEMETIFDMINNQLFDDDKMKEIAKYVLKHNPEDCFIILDGADEWKGSPTSETGRRGDIAGLPGMAGVDSCVIFITSRPWRFHALSEKTQTIFRRLKLKGIADVNMLVESILQKLELPEPVRSSNDFLKQVEENDMSELMKNPLILLITLGSWIDDKSFHKLMCINYIKMIQTFIRRLKGHAGWLSSENRLRLIPNLYDLETKWEQRSNELPSLLLTYKPLHRYAGLFLLLGQLAFNLLLGKEEQFLIFSKADLTSYIQADDENDESVNVCLALGILSKAETTKRGIKKVDNFAFCHKTFQEIFAALWLTSRYTNEASKQYKYIENIQNLYSCDLMITFLCTIEPDTGKKFWIDLMKEDRIKVINLDKTTMNHQSLQKLSGSLSSFSVLNELKLEHLRCSDHSRCCIPVLDLQKCKQLTCLALSNLLVEDLLLPKEEARFELLKLNNVTMAHDGLEQLSRSFSSLSGIKELKLDGVRCSEHTDMCCIPVLDLRKHSELEILYLVDLSVEDLLLLMDGIRIRELELDSVTMTHHGLEQLSRSLSSLSCIKELKLDRVRCSDHTDMCCIPVLDLRKHSELEVLSLWDLPAEDMLLPIDGIRIRELTLDNVTIAHHVLEQLSKSLSSLSCIKALTLYKVRCSEHRDMCCIPVLDLRKHNELKVLCKLNSCFEDMLLPIEGTRISTMILDKVTMAHEGLSRYLSSLSCINYLHLDGVRCSDHRDMCCIPVIDLRKHNELELLYIADLSAEDMLLPMEGIRIRDLTLDSVTMAHHGLEQLLRSLSSLSCIEKLDLDGLKCSEHRDRCCISVLDLQKHNKLELLCIKVSSVEGLLLPMKGTRIRKLALDRVTMAHHGLEQLSRSLASWSCIKELKLDGVRCSEHTDICCIPVIDLRKHNELELLYIVDLSAEDMLLPMEGIRIREIKLDSVTMAHHGLEQLSRSLSSLSCIKELKLDKVRCSEHTNMCCIPALDLQKHNKLKLLYIVDLSAEDMLLPIDGIRIRELTLDNVTIAHHGLEQLSKSLSSLSCIKELTLYKVRCSEHRDMCCIPVLDLRKHNELKVLFKLNSCFEDMLLPIEGTRISTMILDKVTMAHEGLSRYLSSLSCINDLHLDGVRCSDHRDMCCIPVIDLRKHNELEILYIADLSVEDLLLPMEGTIIRELALDKVSIAHHGLEQLSRSLSSWFCIKKLILNGVRCSEHTDMCCIPILDLRKQNELEMLYLEDLSAEDLRLPMDGIRMRELWLDKVTMAHHALEQLSRSLSSWFCIKKLKLDGVRCSEHTDMCCIPILDLRKQNELEILYLVDLSAEDLLLPMDGIRMRELALDKVTLAHHGLEQLSRSLSSWSCIKELKLDGVRCSEHTDMCCIPVLDLQKCKQLTCLTLSNLLVEDLLLPKEEARFITLKLNNVTMAHDGLEELSRSLSS